MTFVSTRGRPPRGTTFRELINGPDRIMQRIQVVDRAYEEAIAGNVRAMIWLATAGGDYSQVQLVGVTPDSPMLAAIDGIRALLGYPPLGATDATNADAIEGEATVVDPLPDPGAGES